MTLRYRFCLLLFVFFFFIIIARLFYWQVVRAEELSFLGKSQYGTFIKIPPQRGEIKTSDGFSIVANRLTFLLFANPKEIKNKNETSILISSILEMDKASVSASLSFNDRVWVPVKSRVPSGKKDEIEKLKLKGFGFEPESSRFYPEASLAAQLVGFVGKNDLGEDKGYFGLEGFYDRQLSGKTGAAIAVHDAFGRPILSKMDESLKAVNGRTLVLNIDRTIQFLAEKKLKDGIEKYGASAGMVGIVDPKTGNVISIASFPSFDQGSYQEYSDSLYRNPFISNLYEPGSTFKALIMASAIDAGVVKPETKCPICDKPVSIAEYKINTWNNKYYKDINMIDVIKHSDNTGMVFAARSLGLRKMLYYLDKFGIGSLTGIDLQGEVSLNLKPERNWYPIDLATASFGQGISVTPIELLTAFASIANEGKRMQPHVVSRIETEEGKVINIGPKVMNNPISAKTAKIMTEILVNAVDKGEAKWAKPKGYRIAGKTGTSQIPIAGHYDPTKTIASFIGFAPADDPKFAMIVIVDRPTTSIYGADTAAPIFFDIAKEILAYYGIPPSE
ncbi:penicillin-binding protein 2 [Candidatus Microgenomates bacterium]|nr:MAG: penicillin-binding protein 2 [Candidatus Microgenomates bacterium]